MVNKFFSSTEVNPDRGGLDYVLKNPTAEVLRGNVAITRAVIESSPANMTHRFASGMLNDTVKLSRTVEEKLLNELEHHILAGRIRESMAWCVIRHRDKGKFEYHYVAALMDLIFRKPMYPYVDRIDRMRYSAWMDQFNLLHGLSMPSQHLRVEPPFDHLRKSKEDVDFLRLVWLLVKKWVDDGDVKNRAELKVRMDASKYKVRWENNWGGPLDQPEIIGPKGRKLRLSGSIYYSPDFGLPAGMPLNLKDKDAVAKHLANLQQTIDERMDFRAFWTIGRLYGKREQDRLGHRNAIERLRKLNADKLRAMHLENAKMGLNITRMEGILKQMQGAQGVIDTKPTSRESTQINNPTGTNDLVNPPGDVVISAAAEASETKADPAAETTIASPENHEGPQLPKASMKRVAPDETIEM